MVWSRRQSRFQGLSDRFYGIKQATLLHRGPMQLVGGWPACRCLRCLLLVMCTYPFAKKALTLHLARGEGRERYCGCNLMQRKVLASSHQHLMAEAPGADLPENLKQRCTFSDPYGRKIYRRCPNGGPQVWIDADNTYFSFLMSTSAILLIPFSISM